MKRYIRSDRESYEGEFNYWYAGQKPASKTNTEIIGKTIGNLEVFQVWIDGEDLGYFWGKPPRRNNINLFGEWALELDDQMGISVDETDSDSSIVNKVNQKLKKIANDPRSKGWFNLLGVDPVKAQWKVALAGWMTLEYNNYTFEFVPHIGDTSDLDTGYFKPDYAMIRKMLESGELSYDQLQDSKLYDVDKYLDRFEKDDEKDKKQANKILKQLNSPYPYDAPEIVTDHAVPELHKYIIRQHLGSSTNLEEAEQYVRNMTVNYPRSTRYNDPKVDNYITELFDWANNYNLSVEQFRSAVSKILKINKAHRDYNYNKKFNKYLQ